MEGKRLVAERCAENILDDGVIGGFVTVGTSGRGCFFPEHFIVPMLCCTVLIIRLSDALHC